MYDKYDFNVFTIILKVFVNSELLTFSHSAGYFIRIFLKSYLWRKKNLNY